MIEIKNTKYYTLSEVAEYFNVNKQTVSRWRRNKLLLGFKIIVLENADVIPLLTLVIFK